MKTVRIALVGCGRIGVEADETAASWDAGYLWIPLSHASAIKAVSGAELVAFCDTDADRAKKAASKYKVKAWFDDLEEMLAEMQPDAVAIATRAVPRVDILRNCIKHGVRGFFCEKPLSLTLEDADSLMVSLRDSGMAFVYGTRRRYMPVYQRAREAFWSGEIGAPQSIKLSFGLAPLLWTHPHTIDLACFFAQDAKVVSVEALADYPLDSYKGSVLDADPLIKSAIIRFENGITARIESRGNFDVELYGSVGSLEVEQDGIRTIKKISTRSRLLSHGSESLILSTVTTPREFSGTENSIMLLVDALNGKASTNHNIALQNMEIIFGIAESALQGGERIPWPLKRRGLKVTGRLGDLYP
jgi:predicted dehydrogenase